MLNAHLREIWYSKKQRSKRLNGIHSPISINVEKGGTPRSVVSRPRVEDGECRLHFFFVFLPWFQPSQISVEGAELIQGWCGFSCWRSPLRVGGIVIRKIRLRPSRCQEYKEDSGLSFHARWKDDFQMSKGKKKKKSPCGRATARSGGAFMAAKDATVTRGRFAFSLLYKNFLFFFFFWSARYLISKGLDMEAACPFAFAPSLNVLD